MVTQSIGNRLIVTRPSDEQVTPSGIVFMQSKSATPAEEAKILAVGPLVRQCKVGDKILFEPYERVEIELNGAKYWSIKEDAVLCVVGEVL